MANVKGKGQRLIPEELLKYLEALKKEYPEAVDLVEANPTLEGGEDSLSSVLINGVKYAVGGGGGATLDDIVDADGNKRFVEGDGTPLTVSGVTSSYCKWTLSGTHLMLVYAGTISSGTTLSYSYLVDFALPNFILNKIIPVSGTTIEAKFATTYFSSQTEDVKIILSKDDNKLRIFLDDTQTFSSYNYSFRFQFDLIIDTE